MLPQSPSDVGCAFDLLESEIRTATQEYRLRAARNLEGGEDEKATDLVNKARYMERLLGGVRRLKDEWFASLETRIAPLPVHLGLGPETRIPVRSCPAESEPNLMRALPGTKLPIGAYEILIIGVLGQLGGRANASVVTNNVFALIKDRLTSEDFDGKASRPDEKHWYNRMHWCRLKMKHKGLLRSDSRPGIWELSEKGWEFYRGLRLHGGEAA